MVTLALACSCLPPMLNLVCYVWLYYNWFFVFVSVLSCVAACYVVADCQLWYEIKELLLLLLELDCAWPWLCAGLAHSVGRSWCGIIHSPSSGDHFRRRYQTAPWETFAATRPFPKLLWADLLYILLVRALYLR